MAKGGSSEMNLRSPHCRHIRGQTSDIVLVTVLDWTPSEPPEMAEMAELAVPEAAVTGLLAFTTRSRRPRLLVSGHTFCAVGLRYRPRPEAEFLPACHLLLTPSLTSVHFHYGAAKPALRGKRKRRGS
ncbi:hypothetical protein TREES_T100012124 [Tupaia chinensis]|uniref:Uncharacterized protein n=1 Tax=Tupaia chinensis TaxID=246437 RepID=L9K094_TUPCH|nr:hypothetical protein TREES_T100012124 [Tupaia chinensis]